MSLRIPLTSDQTLQVEFHEVERRLRRLEHRTGVTVAGSVTTIQSFGSGGGSAPNLNGILARLDAIETALANLPEPDDIDFPEFGPVGGTSAAGIVPAPGVPLPPTGVAEHVIKEDGTWGFPFRGLVQVATSGEHTDPPYDVLDIAAGVQAGHLQAADIECWSLRVNGEVEYRDTFWEDLRFPAQGVNPIGSPAPPGIDTTSGLLSFSGTVDNVIAGVAQMPHSWKKGTNVHPHVHLRFATTAAGTNTRWQFSYDVAAINGDFANAVGTYTALTAVTVASPSSTVKHVYADLGDVPMTGIGESGIMLWQVWRLAASDAADNNTGAVFLAEFDLHFEIEKPGTVNEIP